MFYRRGGYLLALGVTVCVLLASLAQSAEAQSTGVTIQDFAFIPPQINVSVGSTVTWTNQDAVVHTATSDTGLFDSGVLSKGSKFSFTFNQAGTFAYHCAIHPYMTGNVVVGSAAATTTPVPTSPPATVPGPPANTPVPTNTSAPVATSTPSPVPPVPTATSAPALATLRVSVSGTLKAAHVGALIITVKDTHSHAVKGAQVTANLHPVGLSSVVKAKTNAHGTVRLTLKPKRAGTIPIKATKRGFRARTVKVKVRR